MPVVVVGLWRWWIWICCGYEFGNGFVLVVAVDLLWV